jgi:hypothetical protein
MAIAINNLSLVFLKRSREAPASAYEIMDDYLDSRIQQHCRFKITDTTRLGKLTMKEQDNEASH